MSNSEPRELSSPVQLYPASTEGNGSPVRFLGPKGATAPKPAKRQVRSTKKTSKASSKQEPRSASTAEESSPVQSPKVTPTQIPESDS